MKQQAWGRDNSSSSGSDSEDTPAVCPSSSDGEMAVPGGGNSSGIEAATLRPLLGAGLKQNAVFDCVVCGVKSDKAP